MSHENARPTDGAAQAETRIQCSGTDRGLGVGDSRLDRLHDGMVLGGRFRVRCPFSARSRHGIRFLSCELEEGGHRLRAYAWANECQGFHVPRQGDRLYAAGRVRWRAGRFELVCRELRVEDVTARIRTARFRLRTLTQALEPPLAELVRREFRHPLIGPAFLVAPASLNHHHAFSGGLLVHSAETAWSVFRRTEDQPQQGLATVAAMLHDIGKIRTLSGDLVPKPLGRWIRHEALTLEVLADHLAWLDEALPEGAMTLRHLLTAAAGRDAPSPARAALELLRTADRISADGAAADLRPTPRLGV